MEVIGKRFGSRIVTHEVEPRVYAGEYNYTNKQRCFAWLCDCGKTGETSLVNLSKTKNCTYCTNRRHNVKLYDGKPMKQWCEETGNNYYTIMTRISRGMDWKEALKR